jgi:hypothetical protein
MFPFRRHRHRRHSGSPTTGTAGGVRRRRVYPCTHARRER